MLHLENFAMLFKTGVPKCAHEHLEWPSASQTHLAIPGAAAVDAIDVFGFFNDPASDFVTGLAPPANGTVTVLRTNAPSWMDVVRHPTLRKAADLYMADLSKGKSLLTNK